MSSSNFQNISDLLIGIEFGKRRGGVGSSLQELQNLKDRMQLKMVVIMVGRVGQHGDDDPDHDCDNDCDHDHAKVL